MLEAIKEIQDWQQKNMWEELIVPLYDNYFEYMSQKHIGNFNKLKILFSSC